MFWTLIYGAGLVISCALAWVSGSLVYRKLAVYMVASWTLYNVVVRALGFPHGLLIDGLGDALIATAIGQLGWRYKSWPAFWVVVLFAAEEACHLDATLRHGELWYSYHAALNAIFALQVAIIGGCAGVALASYRGPPVLGRAHALPVRRG